MRTGYIQVPVPSVRETPAGAPGAFSNLYATGKSNRHPSAGPHASTRNHEASDMLTARQVSQGQRMAELPSGRVTLECSMQGVYGIAFSLESLNAQKNPHFFFLGVKLGFTQGHKSLLEFYGAFCFYINRKLTPAPSLGL